MKTVFVIGSGTMGRGIAQVAAQAKYEVYLSDIQLDIFKRTWILWRPGSSTDRNRKNNQRRGRRHPRTNPDVPNLENLEKAD
jgi:3-hydroxyacyl-CoA dehydrogenase